MSATAAERRRLGAPEAWRSAAERVVTTLGVLAVLWALWEGFKWAGETTGSRSASSR